MPKLVSIAFFQYITERVNGRSHSEMAELACEGGVRWVQLRMKGMDHPAMLKEARRTRAICHKHRARLIINDHTDIAVLAGADGVHLGKLDMAPAEARRLLGPDKIIGGTANNWDELSKMAEAGVDYIGIGPWRFTPTKENLSEALGPEGLTAMVRRSREAGIELPLIAIGGIRMEDVPELAALNVDGIAVASAVNQDPAPSESAFRFIASMRALWHVVI